MSCEGWGVGDTCRALVVFDFERRSFDVGTAGSIVRKDPVRHELQVQWRGAIEPMLLTHEEIHRIIGERPGPDSLVTPASH